MRELAVCAGALLLIGCDQAAPEPAEGYETNPLSDQAFNDTKVLTAETAKTSEEDWGVFREYFAGQTDGVQDLLSGTATIDSGREIHPPHSHAEEEFLMVISGEGTWTVEGEDFPAKEGDMLYAKAWDSHGIRNTGSGPLTFVFWKWNSKGVPVPVEKEPQ